MMTMASEEFMKITDILYDLKGLIVAVNNKVDNLEKRFDNLEKRMDNLEKRMDNLEKRMDNLEKRMDNLEKRMDNLEERFDNLEKRVDELEIQIKDVDKRMNERFDLLMDKLVDNEEKQTAERMMFEGMRDSITTYLDAI